MFPVLITEENLHARFLLYYMLSEPFVRLMVDESMRVAMPKVNREKLATCPLAIPSLIEQDAIAAFLDRKTARIDALVVKKERLIELLQEQRAALITRAVTKGLDPNVPVKDSGVEWLGEIPAHWQMLSLKRVTSIRYGLGEPPQLLADGLPLVRATNVTKGRIVDRDMQFVDPKDVPWNRDPALQTGEIIVVRSGAYTGDSAIIPESHDGAIAGYDMVVRVRRGQPKFLAWALLSQYVLEAQIELESMRAAQPHLNSEELGAVAILLPPDLEQHAIAAFLDLETERIDALVAKVREASGRLKELRTALISAAVTGKIDVREEVA
jgi:type I restriction enzyme S subunit